MCFLTENNILLDLVIVQQHFFEFLDIYGFNQLASDEISFDRAVPDMRESECRNWDYPEDLPTASVIFIFHNEGWSTLLRSVHSVINR